MIHHQKRKITGNTKANVTIPKNEGTKTRLKDLKVSKETKTTQSKAKIQKVIKTAKVKSHQMMKTIQKKKKLLQTFQH